MLEQKELEAADRSSFVRLWRGIWFGLFWGQLDLDTEWIHDGEERVEARRQCRRLADLAGLRCV